MKRPSHRLLVASLVVAGITAMTAGSASAAQPPVGLGSATSFAVLGGSTVTNTGPSVITGDLGASPGSAVIGFPPGIDNGVIHAADAVANLAQVDLTNAYNDAAGRIPVTSAPADLSGQVLVAGVYGGPTLGLTGTVTLDAQGDPNAVFVFQAASTLITASNSVVSLVNGADPCNVYWQVGSSATLGTTSTFVGTVMALTSITATTAATVQGRLLARNGAVTLDSNVITAPTCAVLPPTTTTTTTAPTTTAAPSTTVDIGATTTSPGGAATSSTPGSGVTTSIPPETTTPTPATPPAITLPVTGSATGKTAWIGTLVLLVGLGTLVAVPRIPRRRRR